MRGLTRCVVIGVFLIVAGCQDSLKSSLVHSLYLQSLTNQPSDETKTAFTIGEYEYELKDTPGIEFPTISQRKSAEDSWNPILTSSDLGSFQNLSLGLFRPSIDGAKVAFITSPSFGGVWVKNLIKDEKDFVFVAHPVDLQWHPDGETLYISERIGERVQKLVSVHGVNPPKEILVASRPDQFISLSRSPNEEGLFIQIQSPVDAEMWFIDFHTPQEARQIFKTTRASKLQGNIHNGKFEILETEDNGESFLSRCAEQCERALAFPKDLFIEDAQMFQDEILLHIRKEGQGRLAWFNLETGGLTLVQMPFQNGEIVILPETAQRDGIQIQISSWLSPPSVYAVKQGQSQLTPVSLTRLEPSLNLDIDDFKITETEIPSFDGVMIPISMIENKNSEQSKPLVLMVYGSYEVSLDPSFTYRTALWLSKGLGVAIAHVRGGGEKGRGWYQSSTHGRKMIGIKDLLAAASWLRQQGNQKIALYGRSAGGLIAARAMIESPKLFKAVVLEVPFVNVTAQLLDESEVDERVEWGDLNNPFEAQLIHEYDPMQALKEESYPPILITAHEKDAAVPARFIQQFYEKINLLSHHGVNFHLYTKAEHLQFPTRKAERLADAELSAFLIENLQ